MQYDEIKICDLEVFANHGVYEEENKLGQKFIISATLYLNTRVAALDDDLNFSVNYGEVCHFITDYMHNHTYKLIETVVENLAQELLINFSLLLGAEIELKKPWAPIGLPIQYASIKIRRFWHQVYLGLGSNMGDKKAYLDHAIELLNANCDSKVMKVADYLVTEPYGGVEQDDFLNTCLLLKTLLSPNELLDRLHDIENDANRKRTIHWGPRTLDLDILLYDDLIVENDDLIIPHIEMHKRDFVLRPLSQIAPNLRHPIYRETVLQMLDKVTE